MCGKPVTRHTLSSHYLENLVREKLSKKLSGSGLSRQRIEMKMIHISYLTPGID